MAFLDKWLGGNKKKDKTFPSPPLLRTEQASSTKPGRRYSPGDKIADRYEVVKVLTGGMGVVYLCADHAEEGAPVALKTFKPKYLPDRAARDRFLREGTIWVGLGHHPNIVRAHRVERLAGGLEIYLVLEWVAQAENREDASLRAWLQEEQALPLDKALLFALHIARGMNHAVSKIPGLIHRDLKPENVLVGRDNVARVTDFGLASVLASLKKDIWHTGTGALTLRRAQLTRGGLGTPLYMSPEQWTKGAVLDMRADIYAFGCILFEMLAGYRPVKGKSVQDVARAHKTGQVVALPDALPQGVKALVKGCMAVQADQRFQTWADVEKAVTLVYRRILKQDIPHKGQRAAGNERAEDIAAGWSYDAMGLSYHDIGRHDLAAGYFERVIWIARQAKDYALEGAGLNHLGATCLATGDVLGALEFHEQHLSIARQIGDRGGESDALGNLGQAYRELGETTKALTCYEEQLELAQSIKDHVREGQALSNLGNLSLRDGNTQEAMRAYKQALSINWKTKDQVAEGRILANIGRVYAEQEDFERAFQFYEQALDIARKVGDRAGEGNVLGRLGKLHREEGDDQQALWFLINCLGVKQEIGDRLGEGQTLCDLGEIYLDAGETQQAIESYQTALKIARLTGNHSWTAQILSRLGDMYSNLDESWRAIGFYRESLTIVKDENNPREEARLLHRLGNRYRANRDFFQARQAYQDALSILSRQDDAFLEAQVKFDFSIVLTADNKLDDALTYAKEAAETFKKLGQHKRAKKARELTGEIKQRRRRWF